MEDLYWVGGGFAVGLKLFALPYLVKASRLHMESQACTASVLLRKPRVHRITCGDDDGIGAVMMNGGSNVGG